MSDDAAGTDQPEPEPEPRDHAEADTPAGDERPTPSGPRLSDGYVCDICGSPMLERHCKILCPNCGYQRDCSDP